MASRTSRFIVSSMSSSGFGVEGVSGRSEEFAPWLIFLEGQVAGFLVYGEEGDAEMAVGGSVEVLNVYYAGNEGLVPLWGVSVSLF